MAHCKIRDLKIGDKIKYTTPVTNDAYSGTLVNILEYPAGVTSENSVTIELRDESGIIAQQRWIAVSLDESVEVTD